MEEELLFGIIVIFGKFGKGKGFTNTIFAINQMEDERIYENSLSEISELEEFFGREFSKPPERHVVYSNYDIKYNGFKSYDFDPDKFMLPNGEFDFDIFPPYSCFHVEESQSGTFSCYEWTSFPKPALLALARVRHPKYLFILDVQNIENLNANIRKFTFLYITPITIEQDANCLNVVTKSKSQCAVFKNYDKAMQFEKTQDYSLIEEIGEYSADCNVFDYYDSFSKKLEFFEVNKNKDFVYRKSKIKSVKNEEIIEMEIAL